MSEATADFQIIEFLKMSSLNVIRAHSRIPDFALGSVKPGTIVFGHWTAFLLVASKEVRITLKSHFMSDVGRKLASGIYSQPAASISLENATDFFKEYCNLWGGNMKGALVANGQDATASLPILTRGFDEVFSSCPQGVVRACWLLKIQNLEFACSVQTELQNPIELKYDASEYERQKGEIEFFE